MKKIIPFILLGLCATTGITHAQTYSSTGAVAIPDGGSPCGTDGPAGSSDISVPLTGVISTPTDVTINISFTHAFVGDIRVELVAPDASTCILMNHLGATTCSGSSSTLVPANILSFNAANITPVPTASSPIPAGNYAPTGSTAFPAVGDLSTFLSGKSVNGTWSIRGIDNFSSLTGSIDSWDIVFGPTALPLDLLSFSGSTHSGYNKLRWESGVEKNIDRIELERNSSGLSFEKISSILPRGNNSLYEYNDQIDAAGVMMYRLKIIENDGKASYSSVVKLVGSAAGKNNSAVLDGLRGSTVVLTSGDAELIGTRAQLLSTMGELLQQFPVSNLRHTIDMSGYPPAVYFLRLANGETLKFVKKD